MVDVSREDTPTAVLPPVGVLQSRVHRFQVGDNVEYTDVSTFPPTALEGKVTAFANEPRTYLVCNFTDGSSKTLTEDEVHRLPPDA